MPLEKGSLKGKNRGDVSKVTRVQNSRKRSRPPRKLGGENKKVDWGYPDDFFLEGEAKNVEKKIGGPTWGRIHRRLGGIGKEEIQTKHNRELSV